MSAIQLLTIFCIFTFFTSLVNAQADSQCFTPNNRPGVCVDIRACSSLVRLLQTRSNDPVAVEFLRSSTCGFKGSIPLVCCDISGPPLPIQSTTTTTTTTTTTQRTTTTPRTTPSTTTTTTTEDYDYLNDNDDLNNNNGKAKYSLPRGSSCGRNDIQFSKIVGGRDAELGEFPWIVALGYKNSKNPNLPKWLCGGSLITEKHVLTAGHCVSKRNDLYLIRAGELDLYDNNDGASPVDVEIEKVKLHENYNPTSVSNDIALLTLQREVRGRFITPVCLPLDEPLKSRNFVGFNPIVAGWGSIYFNGPSSSRLQAVMLPIVRTDQCKNAFSAFKNVQIDDRVLCAGYLQGKKDSCQGDSGGPMIIGYQNQFYQLGVVSYGFRCAAEGFPGVYTRVTTFLDWIEKNLN